MNAHDVVDRPSTSLQVLDTEWVFDLKINTTTRMIERFKTRIVANDRPQIPGFDCYDVHAPTIPMLEIKLLLVMELFQMDTTTAFLSAALKPGELVYCNPPRGVDLGLGSIGLPRYELLLKALVLLQCARLNPAVFSFNAFFCSSRVWRCVLDVSSSSG